MGANFTCSLFSSSFFFNSMMQQTAWLATVMFFFHPFTPFSPTKKVSSVTQRRDGVGVGWEDARKERKKKAPSAIIVRAVREAGGCFPVKRVKKNIV